MNLKPPQDARRWSALIIGGSIFACALLLWLLRPQPLWNWVDAAPSWGYYIALAGGVATFLIVDFIHRRLQPPQPKRDEFDLDEYAITNQPTTVAQVTQILLPFWWILVDRLMAPWLQQTFPGIEGRALYLAVVLPTSILAVVITRRKRGAAAGAIPEDLTRPSF